MKLILHLHGGLGIPPYLMHQPLKKIAKQVYDATIGKIMMLGANHILSACKSDAILAKCQFRIPDEKISVVYNAIDMISFNSTNESNNEENKPYLLFVGDLERWKGLQVLIEAMKILRNRGKDYALKLAGVGSLRYVLQNSADGLDVQFLGAVPHSQIPDLMRDAFACVLPSNWEGIPTVGLEAMASGTPFIGTNVGGIPELINPDITGLLVSPNAPREIANAVEKLQNTDFRNEVIRNASEFIQHQFTIQSVTKETLTVYNKLL
jgi:glycosyltransferase involved in cell wall biosynthesis